MVFRTTLSQQVYENVVNRIANHELKPGTRIKEIHIAKELGVSPTPVREALKKLEKELWIKSIPHKGACVRELNEKEVVELYDIREYLEALAARLAANLATSQQISRMEEYAFKELELIEDDRWTDDEGTAIDIKFHQQLVKASQNARLEQMISLCNLQVKSFLLTKNVPTNYDDRRQFADEHVVVVEVLKKRDAGLAEKLVREHIKGAKERTLRFIRKHLI